MSNPIRIKGVLYDSLSAACRAYGVMLQTVLLRIKRGETVEQAFTLPMPTAWIRVQFTADTAPDCGAVTWYGRPGGKNEDNFYRPGNIQSRA